MSHQPKILCVTPNPSIDRTLMVPHIRPGEVHRSHQVIVDAGGKGLNVARAVQKLGGRPTCTGFTGGLSGQSLARLAASEGLEGRWVTIGEETRTCVIVVSEEAGEATVFNENGPTVVDEEWQTLSQHVLALSQAHDAVCFSGSLPAGSSLPAFANLITELNKRNVPHFVDTSRAPLAAAVAARPHMVKVNQHEASEIVEEPVETVTDAVGAAQKIQRRGVPNVIITLGQVGAILVTAAGEWWARPPVLNTVSAVASGDCFLAGVVVAHCQGASGAHALRSGVAAGSANALTVGGAHFTKETYAEILAAVEITALS